MKTITFLVAGLLLTGSLATASETKVFSGNAVNYNYYPVDYREAEPIIFMERGIEFMVFPDGQMDFNTQPATTGDNYYRRRGQSGANATYGAPGTNNTGGVRVEHDYNGLVRRVGNVYINYDYNGRVKRIGSVYMSYNRYALDQIGLLKLVYDSRGRIIDTRGYINANNRSYVYQPVYGAGGYNNNQQYQGGQGNYNGGNGYNDNNNNDNYYYRKANTGSTTTKSGGSRQ